MSWLRHPTLLIVQGEYLRRRWRCSNGISCVKQSPRAAYRWQCGNCPSVMRMWKWICQLTTGERTRINYSISPCAKSLDWSPHRIGNKLFHFYVPFVKCCSKHKLHCYFFGGVGVCVVVVCAVFLCVPSHMRCTSIQFISISRFIIEAANPNTYARFLFHFIFPVSANGLIVPMLISLSGV